MGGRTVRVTAIVAAALVVALVAFLYTRPVAQQATPVSSALLGTAAPHFDTTTLSGTKVAVPGGTGHVVVLSFFASWCGPCATEAPELSTFDYGLHRSHSTTRVIGVVFNDSDASATSFARTYGLTYPVVTDPAGSIASAFGVTGPPVTVVVNAEGRISSILDGPVTEGQLTQVVAAAEGSRT